MNNNFTVYIHKLPNNKIYVGYLDMNSGFVNGRTFDEVMECGKYHENRTALYTDIKNYSWEQVTTEIISGLTKEQALEQKKNLCLEYQSYLPELGYNHYRDAGLSQPPKVNKTPKGKLAKKIISMFLHGDFTLYDYVLKHLESYSDKKISELFEKIKNDAGHIALCLTHKKFYTPYSEAQYLLTVIDDPYCLRYVP